MTVSWNSCLVPLRLESQVAKVLLTDVADATAPEPAVALSRGSGLSELSPWSASAAGSKVSCSGFVSATAWASAQAGSTLAAAAAALGSGLVNSL